MKIHKLLFLFLLISCSSTKIAYDYDKTIDFTKITTFNFFDDVGKGLNEFDIKRIKNTVIAQLIDKGMHLNDTPEIFVNFFSEEQKDENRNTIGIGIGGGRNVGFGISRGIPINSRKRVQKLTIDFVGISNNKLIWEGVVKIKLKEKMLPEEKITYYNKIVSKIFEGYPPNKKTSN